MKLSILLSSAILLATALTPISAHADDQNLQCRRMANGCDLRGSNGRLSISGFDINVNTPKSSDRGNRNKETASNTLQNGADNDTGGNDNSSDVDNDNSVNDSNNSTDTADIDNNNDNNNDTTVDADNGTGNDTDPVADNNSNNSPVQNNSNDIKGFDPFGGLYGPGT